MNDLSSLVTALRVPLLHGKEWEDLGQRLRAACDSLVGAGALPDERVGPFREWRRRLDRFEKLPSDDRDFVVARGLRLCAAVAGSQPAPPPPPPPSRTRDPGGPLAAGAASLPGIGPTLAQRLAEKGLVTIEDLAWLVPRRYHDLRDVLGLAAVLAHAPGERVTFLAEVRRIKFSRFRRRFLEVELVDGEHHMLARWFNVYGGMARRFTVGEPVVLSGIVREHKGQKVVANPEVLGAPDDDGGSARAVIQPRYPEVEGVAPAILRRACREAAVRAGPHLQDGLPSGIAGELGLPDLAVALASLHTPPRDLDDQAVLALCEGESPWHRRLAFDELFFLAMAVARRRARRDAFAAPACRAPRGAVAELDRVYPFPLTAAQRRSIATIVEDLGRDRPMNRLLQGDVGSGKTAVAFAAALAVMAAGRQVALMAPTELLAEQHLATIGPWAQAVGRRVALLTASTPRGARESILGLLAAGAIDLVVGTHALLADRVDFSDLGLVIIDEQHRFGVAQRVRLRVGAAGEGRATLPHLLVMTATPIPRSLALTIYGDLDVATLDELPAGRAPPTTRVLTGERGRKLAYHKLAEIVDQGARAFVVCPLVAPSEETDWRDAISTAERLAEELAPRRVGLVHGRMPPVERDAAMARLRAGELQVLVATTVIEVGVDVPAAKVMVVEDADRFGLAQLHQLRGRVGRGGGASHCLLLTRGARTSEAAQRLAVMEASCDGFKIAEEDLKIRGPGEILGVKQAGLPKLRFADVVRNAELAARARRCAEELLATDPALRRHPVTAAVLEARLAAEQVSGEGG